MTHVKPFLNIWNWQEHNGEGNSQVSQVCVSNMQTKVDTGGKRRKNWWSFKSAALSINDLKRITSTAFCSSRWNLTQ